MTILDHRGLPIEKDALREPQTAKLGQLRSEFENHPSRGLTPPKLAKILQAAEQGDLIAQHELFQDIEEKDGHIFSVMQTRRLALQGLDWDVVAPENATPAEEELAAFAKAALLDMADFEDVLFDMTDAIGHGFAALELEWCDRDGFKLLRRATHRPQAWFTTPQTPGADRNELRLRDTSAGADGAALWPFGWVLHKHKSRSGYVARSGLFRMLVWPFIFKNYAHRDLAEFLEIYGLPLRLGTYNPSATKEDKATLLRAVVNIGHDAAAIIPESMKIDFQRAAQGDNKAFDSMITSMEKIISKVVLGGTLTSGEGEHGTQALGNVHNELRHDLMQSDARQLAGTITSQLIYPVLAINKGVTDMRRCPRLVFDTQEPEDVKLYADSIPKLVGMGMRIKRGWAHEKLKIPEADEGDQDVLVAPRPEPAVPAQERPEATPQPKPAQARLRAQPAAGQADELDELADEMLAEWQEGMGELIDPVQAALASAASFEEFSQALEAGLAEIQPGKLVDLLARGTFAARVWGRLNLAKRPAAEK
jgi:phage gp29-like protein